MSKQTSKPAGRTITFAGGTWYRNSADAYAAPKPFHAGDKVRWISSGAIVGTVRSCSIGGSYLQGHDGMWWSHTVRVETSAHSAIDCEASGLELAR